MSLAHFTPSQRRVLAKAILRLLERWRISPVDRARALGLADKSICVLQEPELMFMDHEEVFERACSLLRVHQLLERLLPNDPTLQSKWISSPNRRLAGLSPLQIIQESGTRGADEVLALLEQQFR